jgi:hypothetical protein
VLQQTEQQIETDVINWLNSQPNVFAFKFPRGQKSATRRNTVRHSGNGVSDIICNIEIAAILFTVYIEVKRPGGKLRESQVEFSKRIKDMGGSYLVIHSVGELKECFPGLLEDIEERVLISKIPW